MSDTPIGCESHGGHDACAVEFMRVQAERDEARAEINNMADRLGKQHDTIVALRAALNSAIPADADDSDIGGMLVAKGSDGSWLFDTRAGARRRLWPVDERITALEAALEAVIEAAQALRDYATCWAHDQITALPAARPECICGPCVAAARFDAAKAEVEK